MPTDNLAEAALWELWWVVVMIGGPALLAVLWQARDRRKARKYTKRTIDLAAQTGYIERRREEPPNHLKIIPSQRTKDEAIFNTVEEYRNESR